MREIKTLNEKVIKKKFSDRGIPSKKYFRIKN